jgi:serine/threonine protein kinase
MERLSEESVGTTSDGGHHVLLELAQGGTANVVLAVLRGAQGVDKLVVLKVLKSSLADPDLREMFVREARFSARLNHANIVQTSGIIETAKGPAIVMEYLEGHSLAAVLARARTAIPLAMHLRIIVETLRGLHYAHELTDLGGTPLNVVHRDVSPHNVMIAYDGHVKLLDFGVAKFSSAARSTRDGTVKGKPAYLAPEQLEGKQIDGRVDLFALGIVMHEMLSLQHLFAGDSDLHTARKIMEMKIPRLTAHRSDVPAELERIVMRALERDRRKRFSTAAEMARALDDFVVGSQHHLEEVAAFVREIEAISPLARPALESAPHADQAPAARPDPQEEPTVKDHSLRPRARRYRPTGPHLAAAIGLSLAALGLGTAVGLRMTTAAASEPTSAAIHAAARR